MTLLAALPLVAFVALVFAATLWASRVGERWLRGWETRRGER